MKRVLILSASAGAGHVSAANALENELQARESDLEVKHVDALQYTNAAFRRLLSRTYIEMVNKAPGVLGLLYDYADCPWKYERRRMLFDRMNAQPLIRMIKKFKPDLVICTHFLPAEIISHLICTGRINTKLAVVVTDMDIHSVWMCHHYSLYAVALEETRIHMVSLGFDPEKILVSGIPIDPKFQLNKDKRAMRVKYGLKEDTTTIYLSSGGFGVGPTEQIIESLSTCQHEIQVLAMCGKNAGLKRSVEKLAARLEGKSNLTVVPVGYTTDVDEYMSAADIVLGKPGGLTTSEALAKDLIFVIVNPIPGQEERNSDHLLEQGAAIRCNNLPALGFKIDSLLDDPNRIEELKSNVRRLARPDAVSMIADKVLTLHSDGSEGHLHRNLHSKHRCDSILRRVGLNIRKTMTSTKT